MATIKDYKCTSCGKHTQRDLLTVKKVTFLTMGRAGKTVKTRTAAWLCPPCLVKDPVYRMERWHDSPGLREEGDDDRLS